MTQRGACDPLADARREVAALLSGLGIAGADAMLAPVFSRLRQRWGGDRPYISRVERSDRNRIIADGVAAGLDTATIAARASVHPSTVRRASRDWAI